MQMALLSPLRVQDVDLSDFELFVQGKAHDVWRLLRAEAPVHGMGGSVFSPGLGSAKNAAVVTAVAGDTTPYSPLRGVGMRADPENPTPAPGGGKMLTTIAPPQHVRLRRLVNK